jgi:RND family efflux transporter MFP subunit
MNTRTLIGLVAAAALAGCGPSSETISGRTQHLQTEPTTAKVARRDIVGYSLLQGSLYVPPTSDAIVRAPYDSPVQELDVKVGQRVAKGELILKMSLPDQQQYLAETKSALSAAETAYANAHLTYGSGTREAERQLAQARSTERTLRQSVAQGGDSSELQNAVTARQESEEALIQARADENEKVLPYKQQLDQARAAYQAAQRGERQANVAAPISGTVVELNAQTGQQLAGGTPIAHVVDLADIQVKCDLTPAQATLVEKDKPVVVTFEGLEDKPFDGTVTDVQTLPATATGVKRQATIDFKNDAGLVKPGMPVKSVGVKIGETRDALAVPATAVFQDSSGRFAVRVQRNGEWRVQPVEIGLSDGFFTQVKSGVTEGETVRVPGAL